MGRNYVHTKQFLDFRGIDLRSSEVTREPGFASDGSVNCVHSPQGGLTCRHGFKNIASGYGSVGSCFFQQTDILGTQKSGILAFGTTSDGSWAILKRELVTITNSHATDAATAYFYYDGVNHRFKISRGGADVVSVNVDSGSVTMSGLRTTINAVASLAMSSLTYVGSSLATNLEIFYGINIPANGGTFSFYAYYWETLTTPAQCVVRQTGLFGSETLTPVSAVSLNNVVYVATSGYGSSNLNWGYLSKYDGNRVYRAGMPILPTSNITITGGVGAGAKTNDVRGDMSVSAAGAAFAGTQYALRMVNIDKAGNRVESSVIKVPQGAFGAGVSTITSVQWTQPGIFNTAFARTSSAQAGVTAIAVTAGHTMQAGDIAYFYDSSQSRFIQREVTSTDATTVTVSTTSIDNDTESRNYDDGGVVSVQNDALITNNARLAIYRNTTPGQEGMPYYLVDEVPNWQVNNTVANAFVYYDNTADSTLDDYDELLDDEFPHDPPPDNCKFLSIYNGGLVASGDYKNPNKVYFSDVDGPEYWPKVTHNFDLEAPVAGHRQSGEVLVCGTSNSLHVTSGVLSEFNFRVDQIGTNIGVTSHESMREIEEGVLCFSSNVGPYVLFGGRRLEPLGAKEYPDGTKTSRLEPFWTKSYTATETKPVFSRAQAVVYPDFKLYLLFVPLEDPLEPTFATTSSVVWAFDYGRGAWWKWTGVITNFAGGAVVWDGQVFATGVTQTGSGVAVANADPVTRILLRKANGGAYNYTDNGEYITWTYRSHWESLGAPSMLKRFLRCRVSSHETRLAATTTVDLNTYVDYSTSNTSNDDTLTFTTQLDLKPKLKAENCRSMMVEFTKSVRHDPMIISGYELEAVAQFRPEMKE